MIDPTGFGLRERTLAFAKVLLHFAFSACILVAGELLRRLIGWTLTDIPNRAWADTVVDSVTLAAAALTAFGVASMSILVFVDDLYTEVKLHMRYNAAARSGEALGGGEANERKGGQG